MKTELEKMISEALYMASDEELVRMRQKARKLTRLYNLTTEDEENQRQQLMSELLGATKNNFFIEPPFRCDYGSNISIGENFYANFDCVILDVAPVTIGDNVKFGPRVGIYTAGHPIDPAVRARGLEFGRRISIGDNCWIGANVSINPGVTIGNNVIIGSGSVVTKNIPDEAIAAGNPCKVIRFLADKDEEAWSRLEKEYHSP